MAGFFSTLFGGGAEKEAAAKNAALYQQYQQKGEGYLKDSYETGRGDLGHALEAWTPLAELAKKYGGGTDMYLDSLGLNGPEGNARATGAFQTNPGFEMQQKAGLDILNRRAGGNNMSMSGNADMDASNFVMNGLNQQYGGWQDRLAGIDKQGLTATTGAATGEAATYGSLAELAKGYGNDQTNLLGSSTSGLANANNFRAAGEAAGAKNLLGAGMSLATLAMGGAGGGGFGSSLVGRLFQPGAS